MKYASIKHLACALVAALAFPTAALAASPVAVWDGDFGRVINGYSLNLNGHDVTDGIITIQNATDNPTGNGYKGVDINYAKPKSGGMTVIVKYSSLAKGDYGKILAVSCVNPAWAYDRTGIRLQTNGQLCGCWNSNGQTSGSLSSNGTAAGSIGESGYMAFVYKGGPSGTADRGTFLYSTPADNIAFSQAWGSSGLVAQEDTSNLYGATIGGSRVAVNGWTCAVGMEIESIAVFSGVLTTEEMDDFCSPGMAYIEVSDSGISVSDVNTQASGADKVLLSVANNATLTMDTAFTASKVYVSCGGTLALSAAPQPSAAELSKLDLSGANGSVVRSWLAAGAVGFNFASYYGNDTSSALASGTWKSNNNDPNGTSTSLLSDGLSTLTWSSANTWDTSDSGSSFIRGYLDDGGNGATITMSYVPYETYDVIIYAATDTTGRKFSPKTVNGTTYTCGSDGIAVAGNTSWGASRTATIAALGTNAMIVRDLTGPLSINGGKDANYGDSENARGGIAAIQIVPVTDAFLTLNGGSVTWSGGAWTDESGATIAVPTGDNITIVVTASTTLTIDETVTARTIEVRGSEDAVLTLVANGGSLYAKTVRVKGGVLQQGSASVLGATPAVVIEDGGTFDLNGLSVNSATAFTIAGDGAGSWPWALTSSTGAGGAILGGLYLSDDATIGGAYELKVGQTQAGYQCYLQGHTLTKIGVGALTGTNMNTPGNGTIDVLGGAMSVNQWNNLNNSGGDTTVILRSGTSLANNTDRIVPMGTLKLLGGTLSTSSKAFKVKTLLTGTGQTANLVFASGASASLTGDLTVTAAMTLEGGATFLKDAEAASDIAVTPALLTAASGTITIGAGVTFNVGTSRPAATFTVDDNATISVQKANASDVPMIKVTAQPANIVLYDENGSAVASPTVMYDSENGTISLGTGIIWVGASGTWSASQFDGKAVETDGEDVSFAQGVPPQSAVTVTVDGAKSVKSMSFNASDTAYTLTGDKITTADGLAVSGTAPVAISNAVDGTVTVNANSTLTLAGETAVLQSGKLSGTGTLVLDPGVGNTYTMSPANTGFTGDAVIKSGTVQMNDATSFGALGRSGNIRIKGGAALSIGSGSAEESKEDERNSLVLEASATYTSYGSINNQQYFPVTKLTLEGDAYAVADGYNIGVVKKWNDPVTVELGNHMLTKTGSETLYLSAANITGSGKIVVRAGTLNVCNGYYYNEGNLCRFASGTLSVSKGAFLRLQRYDSQSTHKTAWDNNENRYSLITVGNLELDGTVTRSAAHSLLSIKVNGYVTGSGTTPVLTLAEGAVLKPSGNGYLRITESLTLASDTLSVDISGVDFAAGKSIPLFKVGSAEMAEMLPAPNDVVVTGGTLPDGWELAKTADGLGYRIRNLNRQLRLILR